MVHRYVVGDSEVDISYKIIWVWFKYFFVTSLLTFRSKLPWIINSRPKDKKKIQAALFLFYILWN